MSVFVHDTRDKPGKHANAETYLTEHGHKIVRSKLYCGDIALLNDQSICIDLKQDLQEVASNLCQQHERFRAECLRAQEAGISLIILIEHSATINSIDAVRRWMNPRLRTSPNAITGARMAAVMESMAARYGITWQFCSKAQTGKKIVEILKGESSNE